jgi:hypothetical protein
MTTFDEREKAFEKKYALDQETRFKATVRRNRNLGLWAAEKLGLSGADADDYAKTVIKADFELPGDEDILRKLRADFAARNVDVSEHQIKRSMSEFLAEAIKQIEAETKKGVL